MKKVFHIPIYNVEFTFVISNDIYKARKQMEHVFGPPPASNTYVGLCSYEGYQFGIFLTPQSSLDEDTVAHELFHLTHRILEWKGTNFDTSHHEHAALLHGYLTKLVRKEIQKFHKS